MDHPVLSTIAYAHSVAVIGGAERVTLAMIRGIKEVHSALLLAPGEGQLEAEARRLGAETVTVDSACYELKRPWATARMLGRAWRSLRGRAAVLHTGDIMAFRGLGPVCRFLGIPSVCHMHYPYPESFLRWVFGARRQPTVFVFCSEELRLEIGGVLRELCPDTAQEVIHNGVDTVTFAPKATPVVPDHLPRIGIVANLQWRKGHEDFLRMAALLKKRGYQAQYDVIGGDILQEPRRPQLERLCGELGLSDDVVFHGQIDGVVSALNALDIVVCASHEEAFPISMLEAMACQKAIVSTDVNGITEALVSGHNALLVKPQQPAALANAVARVLDDPVLADQLAGAARQTVVEQFSDKVFCDKILALYASVLRGARYA